MELIDTSINNLSNQNEDLTPTEGNKQQKIDLSQFFIEKNGQSQSLRESFIIYLLNIFSPFMAITIFLFFFLLALFCLLHLYLKIFLASFGFIISLILLFSFIHKIILVKDISNKKVLVKLVNYLCLTKKKFNIELENAHFYIKKVINTSDEGPDTISYKLFIINDYKNLVDIDLDENIIKNKQLKCIYTFDSLSLGKYGYQELDKVLNDFVGSSSDYKNPLLFDINIYLKEKKIKLDYWGLRKYVKFSDHLFIYYLKGYNMNCHLPCIDITFLFITGILNFNLFIGAMTMIAINLESKKYDVILKVVIIYFAINLFFYILYKFCKCLDKTLYRIDFFYSKNFDRIFIGLVKNTEANYINTFIFQINNINRFIYEKEGNNFNLKVLFKKNEIKQICTLKKQNQNELEGLLCLLNERLISNTNHSLNSYEQI